MRILERIARKLTSEDIACLDAEIEYARGVLACLEVLRQEVKSGSIQPDILAQTDLYDKAPASVPIAPAAPPAPPKKKGGRPKKLVEPAPPVKVPDQFPDQLGAYLKENGPKRRDAIRNALECENAWIDAMLMHPWFEKDGAMITLSSDGHVEFARHSGD